MVEILQNISRRPLVSVSASDVSTVEIIWTLFSVTKGFSNNSATDISATIAEMFKDSAIASNFHLNKLKYLTNWGIAPYIKEQLKDEIAKSEYIVVSFDESLNKKTQTCQMDIVLRYWDTVDNEVKVRYWDSKFLRHTAHLHLLRHFNNSLEGIDISKVIQISMDGPDVNCSFHKSSMGHLKMGLKKRDGIYSKL